MNCQDVPTKENLKTMIGFLRVDLEYLVKRITRKIELIEAELEREANIQAD